jgi:hypothetical protein
MHMIALPDDAPRCTSKLMVFSRRVTEADIWLVTLQ